MASSLRAANHRSARPRCLLVGRWDRPLHQRSGVSRPGTAVDARTRRRSGYLRRNRVSPRCSTHPHPASAPTIGGLDCRGVLRGDLPGQYLAIRDGHGCVRLGFGRCAVRASALPAAVGGLGPVVHCCLAHVETLARRSHSYHAAVTSCPADLHALTAASALSCRIRM